MLLLFRYRASLGRSRRGPRHVGIGGGIYSSPVHYDSALTFAGGVWTLTTREGTVSTFDSLGRRTSVQDRYGNAISYAWTTDRLTGITDTLGRQYSLNYDVNGRVSSIVDFGGRTWAMAYDYLGQLQYVTTPSSTSFPQGRRLRFSYSGNSATASQRSNLVHVWSALGKKTQTLYYDSQDMVSREQIGTSWYTLTYDNTIRQTTVVDRSGNTSVWTFGLHAMPIRVQVNTKGLRTGEPASFVTQYSINASSGMVDYVVYPRGNRVDYTYDGNLNLTELRRRTANTSTNDPSDIVETWQYGVFGQATQYTDPRGNITTYTVDASGNTTQVMK